MYAGRRPQRRTFGAAARHAEIEGHGLRLSGFDGFERRIEAARLTLSGKSFNFNDAGACW